MSLNIKIAWTLMSILIAGCLSSCGPSTPSANPEVISTEAPSQPLLRTTIADFSVASSRLVDEVNGEQVRSGEKFLLVVLAQPGGANVNPAELDLEAFHTMLMESNGQVYVTGSDDSPIISTMAGWVEDEFTIGFRVPVPVAESYTLHWLDNDLIELTPQEQ